MQELKELIRNTSNTILVFENLPTGIDEHAAAQHIWEITGCGLNIDPRYLSCKDRISGDYSTCIAVLHRDTLADYFATLLKKDGIKVRSWDKENPKRK
jgi:hypothetical protein